MKKVNKQKLFSLVFMVYTLIFGVVVVAVLASVYYQKVKLPASGVPLLDKDTLHQINAGLGKRSYLTPTEHVDITKYIFGKSEPFQ